MSGRQDKPVPVDPFRVSRIVPQVLGPKKVTGRGHPHRHSRVAGLCLLDRVHGKAADGVDAQSVEFRETLVPGEVEI